MSVKDLADGLSGLGDAVVARGKRLRTAPSTGGKDQCSEKRSETFVFKGVTFIVWTPDGRECTICREKDSDEDPVGGAVFPGRRWAYSVKVAYAKNEGMQCLYCVKAFSGRWKVQLRLKLPAMKDYLAADPGEQEKFEKCTAYVIEFLKNATNANAYISWFSQPTNCKLRQN